MSLARFRFCFRFIALAVALLLGLSAPFSVAQNVHYQGTLRIGFSDADNTVPGFSLDSGWPRCDVLPHDPLTMGNQTLGTLLVNARGTQIGTGPGAELVFNAVGAGQGGAQEIERQRCRTSLPGPTYRLRSRTASTHLRWPANVGSYMETHSVLSSPASPTATYRLSAGGGIPYAGTTFMTTNPASQNDALTLTKGANHFGGGAPVELHRRFRYGAHLTIGTFGTFSPPYSYGSRLYTNGTFDIWPLPIGDGGQQGLTIPTAGIVFSNPAGLLVQRPTLGPTPAPGVNRFYVRTQGGTTKSAHGAVLTAGGGNTVTPSGTIMNGFSTIDCSVGPCPEITGLVYHQAAVHAWTTGRVRVTNMGGGFETVRSASGFDVATAGPNGTTRRIQLVSPFTTSFAGSSTFGLALPQDIISGIAILELNVIPVPEPVGWSALAVGVAGLGGWRLRKRTRRAR